jgi:hypothetical protein
VQNNSTFLDSIVDFYKCKVICLQRSFLFKK